MEKSYADISNLEFYPKLISDYLHGEESLKPFYKYAPSLSSFKEAISDFSKIKFNRELISQIISEQYSACNLSAPHAELLKNENTFTVCTGHQLCLFTGPLYFIYKIITTINLSEELKKRFPAYNFIPVFWMAGEDHDFEEINHIHLFGKKIEWQNKQGGPIGKYSNAGIEELISEIKNILGENENAKQLIQLFSDAYLKHKNLADATRFLLNTLFGSYGLVIIDGNDGRLKQLFAPVIQDDMFHQTNFHLVNDTISSLKKLSYHHQVNPGEINLFFLSEKDRSKIDTSEVHAEKEKWEEKIKYQIEGFSPNVVLRPLYQQKILPNLAYIGGPNEIAYWLEFKKIFDHYEIGFPVLMVRNSVLWIDNKASRQLNKFAISETEIFENSDQLINKFISKNSGKELDLESEKKNLIRVFEEISHKAQATDFTLVSLVKADLQRTLHSLEHLEKKMLKAEKQKNETDINQIKKMREKLFPQNKLQERFENFIPYYIKYGKEFFELLQKEIRPFEKRMLIFRERD